MKLFNTTPANVAILAIMELGDLPKNHAFKRGTTRGRNPRYNGIGWFTFMIRTIGKFNIVAILAIMELGDLQCMLTTSLTVLTCRNPRYNGIGWFTNKHVGN